MELCLHVCVRLNAVVITWAQQLLCRLRLEAKQSYLTRRELTINCQEKRGALISVFLEVRCLSETSFTPSMLCCQIPPLPHWRIDMNFAVSFNNSPLPKWLIYHLVCVYGGISSSEHGVWVFGRSRFQILARRRALLTDVFLGFSQTNSEITSWIRTLSRHP